MSTATIEQPKVRMALVPIADKPGFYVDVRLGDLGLFAACGACYKEFAKEDAVCEHVEAARRIPIALRKRQPEWEDGWPRPFRTVPVDEFWRTESQAATATRNASRRSRGADVIDEPTGRNATSEDDDGA